MKDIDFDELDRAVNSLMSTTPPADSKPQDEPSESIVTINNSTTPPETKSSATPLISSEPAVVPTETSVAVPVTVRPTVPPAARRAGRFMDMVSTPSDAKPRPSAAPVAAPSREGLTITPRPAESPEVPVSTVPPSPEPSAPAEEKAPVSFDTMPDPIDMHAESLAPAKSLESTSVIEATPPEVVSPNPPLGSAESPFLVDAKVEKRPLNSGSFDPMAQELAHELEGETNDAPDDDKEVYQEDEKGADEPPVVPKVAELDSDLVAIEASEKTDLTQAVETAEAASMVDAPSTPLGASSIAQQYTTQPSSGDQSHAAIYDASQYPQPVTHPAKSKSGWLWVLWVAILLGVGAGGAILLYNLGIIP